MAHEDRSSIGEGDWGAPILDVSSGEQGSIDLERYWRVLLKRRWLIAGIFVLGAVVGLVVTALSPTIYTADTMLLMARESKQVVDIEAILEETLGRRDRSDTNTQFEILRSRSLAAQVIREERIAEAKEPADESSRDPRALIKDWLRAWLPAASDESGDPDPVRSALIDGYLRRLQVTPVPQSRLVKLSFSDTSPELAARVINAHARIYINRERELHSQASAAARAFLDDSMADLQERLDASEAALSAFRKDRRIISLDTGENVVVDQLTRVNEDLSRAETERIGLEARLALIRAGKLDAATLESPRIEQLEQELANLETEYSALAMGGLKRDLQELQSRMEETRRRLSAEQRSIVAGIESAFLAARATEQELRRRLEEQKTAALELKDASVDYAILEREVETNRKLLESVLERRNEIALDSEGRTSNVFVIDEAYPPTEPSSPSKSRQLAIWLLGALAAGIGLALGLDYLDNRLETPEDVELHLGLPNLGVVPDFDGLTQKRRLGRGGGTLVETVTPALRAGAADSPKPHSPDSAATETLPAKTSAGELGPPRDNYEAIEAYRRIRTDILLARAGGLHSVVFTSATESEGKTTTVLNTALMFARLEASVLLIDADLRRPRCHEILGLEQDIGLTEILTGQCSVDDAIWPLTDGLAFLPSGSIPPSPTELLGSERMKKTLAALSQQYKYILIDSPPVLPVSDTVVLSTLVDGVVLVIDQQKTARQLVQRAHARLRSARADVLGVVLNRTNVRVPGYDRYYRQGYY